MALYRYVPSKVELVALMTDAGLGEPPTFDTSPGAWRARLYDWALRLFERFGRHPWALETTVGVRAIGPNEVAWLEQAVAALSLYRAAWRRNSRRGGDARRSCPQHRPAGVSQGGGP